jgi:hypothetical protein
MTATEVYVRATWDPKRGTPGFFLSDPVVIERLAPSYDGWFAGIPVRTNALGFRDNREYAIEKGRRTVRILVLGDSVTYGHGSVYEHTYPYLLEQKLRRWRPDIDWQVWNLGVPGYSTSSELAYLRREGKRFNPDLVIVGFYWNDVAEQVKDVEPGMLRRLKSTVLGTMKGHLYSYDLFRKAYYRFKAGRSQGPYANMLETIAYEESLLAVEDKTTLREQRLTQPAPLGVPPLTGCPGERDMDPVKEIQTSPDYPDWRTAVETLQGLHRNGTYRIVFFVNAAPNECRSVDRYYDGSFRTLNAFFTRTLSDGGTPVVSSYEAFKKYRPSEMPLANGHSLGNANEVKASALFEFLTGYLPKEVPLLRPASR